MNMKKEDMPREKLIELGASNLTDYELLAIMLGSGTKKENVVDLSIRLINEYGLSNLIKMEYNDLKKINGIKEAKASKLMSTFEIVRRVIERENKENIKSLTKPNEVYDYIISDYLLLNHEKICIIYLNSKLKVLEKSFFDGDLAIAELPIKKIIKKALNIDAYGIILIHNHPSGDINPSIQDIDSTKSLNEILSNVNIVLFDHLIISSNGKYFSFNDNNINYYNI